MIDQGVCSVGIDEMGLGGVIVPKVPTTGSSSLKALAGLISSGLRSMNLPGGSVILSSPGFATWSPRPVKSRKSEFLIFGTPRIRPGLVPHNPG